MNTKPAVANPLGTVIFMPPVTLPVLVVNILIGTTVVWHSRTVMTFTMARRPSTARISLSVVYTPVGRNATTRYVPGSRSANVGVPLIVRGSGGSLPSTPMTATCSIRTSTPLSGAPVTSLVMRTVGRTEADVAEDGGLRITAADRDGMRAAGWCALAPPRLEGLGDRVGAGDQPLEGVPTVGVGHVRGVGRPAARHPDRPAGEPRLAGVAFAVDVVVVELHALDRGRTVVAEVRRLILAAADGDGAGAVRWRAVAPAGLQPLGDRVGTGP